MKRRDFIKKGMPLAVAPIIGTQAFASLVNPLDLSEKTLSMLTFESNRILVIINLSGGNDGLATFVPNIDVNDLNGHRNQGSTTITRYYDTTVNNVLIPKDFVTYAHDNTFIINKNIESITQMSGANCAIINGVGLATPNPSHFCAQDVWQCGTGTYSESVIGNGGWIGKFFKEYQNNYVEYNTNGTVKVKPLAVQVGGSLPRAFMHPSFDKYYLLHPSYTGGNLKTANPMNDCNIANVTKELKYLREQFSNTDIFNSQIQTAYDNTINDSIGNTYSLPDDGKGITTSFRSSMKTIARLIRGGLGARIYTVTLNGFDTHSDQLNQHNLLLSALNIAITGFQADINSCPNDPTLGDRVLGMTFSEFGRRIKSNGTGTDHGATSPMFLFGKKVTSQNNRLGQGGLNGINTSSIDASTNTFFEYDYRTVYSAVIDKWFGATAAPNIISQSSQGAITKSEIEGLIT